MKTCKFCGSIIQKKPLESNSYFSSKLFCSRSCAASYQNQKNGCRPLQTDAVCNNCKTEFKTTRSRKLHCADCAKNWRSLEKTLNRFDVNITKEALFKSRKNWQSARTAIRKEAVKTFAAQNKDPKCLVCGYSNHVEVCHKKPVSAFLGTATIKEINSPDNLIGLCPNHHWEFDNGLLSLE